MERGLGENLFYKKGFHQNCKLCKAKRATRKQVLRKQNEPDQQKTDSRRGLLNRRGAAQLTKNTKNAMNTEYLLGRRCDFAVV